MTTPGSGTVDQVPVRGPAVTPASLLPSEERVLRVMATGTTADEAATRLGLSTHTVRHHLRNVYQRLDVPNLPAAYTAIGWLQVPA